MDKRQTLRDQLAALIDALHNGIESLYNGSYVSAGEALETARQLGYRLLGFSSPARPLEGDRLVYRPVSRTELTVHLRTRLQWRFPQWKDAAEHYGIKHYHMSNIANGYTRPKPWMLADIGAYYGYVQNRERTLTADQVRTMLRDLVRQRFGKRAAAALHYGIDESTLSAKLRDGAKHGPTQRMLADIGVEHGFFLLEKQP